MSSLDMVSCDSVVVGRDWCVCVSVLARDWAKFRVASHRMRKASLQIGYKMHPMFMGWCLIENQATQSKKAVMVM